MCVCVCTTLTGLFRTNGLSPFNRSSHCRLVFCVISAQRQKQRLHFQLTVYFFQNKSTENRLCTVNVVWMYMAIRFVIISINSFLYTLGSFFFCSVLFLFYFLGLVDKCCLNFFFILILFFFTFLGEMKYLRSNQLPQHDKMFFIKAIKILPYRNIFYHYCSVAW